MKVASAFSDTADENSSTNVTTKPVEGGLSRRARHNAAQNNVMILRASVILCIFIAAAIVGYSSYEIVRRNEHNDFENTYDALMKQFVPATSSGMTDRVAFNDDFQIVYFLNDKIGVLSTVTAVRTAVNILGDLFPNSTVWPNVAYSNFPELSNSLTYANETYFPLQFVI